jgi:hypothetical protein
MASLQELQDRLSAVAAQRIHAEKLESRLADLEAEEQKLAGVAAQYQDQLAKEERDVQRLEGLSLTAVFYTILGSKEEQLEKERQEALAAQLRFDEKNERLTALRQDIERTRQERVAIPPGLEAEHHDLLVRLEEQARQLGGETADRLRRWEERQEAIQEEEEQVREALAAGRAAKSSLDRAVEALRSASNWGTWDMFGGGMLATAMKHSRIDDARREVSQAQRHLAAFRRELEDVGPAVAPGHVTLDGFTSFADYFFDGLIVDWVVQKKIEQSLDRVRGTQRDVARLVGNLDDRSRRLQAEREQIYDERSAYLASCRTK